MGIKVQGRLMQVRFIEIHQGFVKKNFGYFCNRVIHLGTMTQEIYMCAGELLKFQKIKSVA